MFRPKLLTFFAVLASLMPILWEGGVGSDMMKPIAAPIVGRMITFDHSRSDSRARLFRDDEGARARAEHCAQAGRNQQPFEQGIS